MTLDEALRELDAVTKDRMWYRERLRQLEAKPAIAPDLKAHLELVSDELRFIAERISNRATPHLQALAAKCLEFAKG